MLLEEPPRDLASTISIYYIQVNMQISYTLGCQPDVLKVTTLKFFNKLIDSSRPGTI